MFLLAINLFESNVHNNVVKHGALKHPELDNNEKLSDFEVKYDSKLYLLIGKSYAIELSGDPLVADVKQEIIKKNKLKDEGIDLFFGGEDLDDTKSLSHYDIKNGCIFFIDLFSKVKKVFVKTLTGNILEIECCETSTIEYIKTLVTKREGVSSDRKPLYYNGKFLEDSRMLKDYNIVDESFLNFELRPETIFVRTLTGNTFEIPFSPTSSIEFIKSLVTKHQGIPCDQQRLIFAGKQLEDGKLLEDYNVADNCTLHLILRLKGGDLFFVKFLTGRSICIELSQETTVHQVKEEIWEKMGIFPLLQRLICNGLQLESNKTVKSYNPEQCIYCMLKGCRRELESFVEVLGRNQVIYFPLNIENMTIQDLKKDLEKRENISMEEQHIFFYSAKK